MSNNRVSSEYSIYSVLTKSQFVGSPIHSSQYVPTNSAKELLFLMKTSNALKEIDINDEEEENNILSESSNNDSFKTINFD